MTLNNLVQLLENQQIPLANLEALNLIELVSQTTQTKILAGDFELSKSQIKELKKLVKLRQELPLAYLKQKKEFYGLEFYIDQNVLIPRPESEDLITAALKLTTNFKQIYDVGCGSGCLGISYALKVENKTLKINFLDISQAALKVTQKNCQKFQVEGANFIEADLEKLKHGYFIKNSLIFANLPYVDKNKRNYYENKFPLLKSEPPQALYTTGGGLRLYQTLFEICQNQDLTLVCETLKSQQPNLIKLALKNGFRLVAQPGLASIFKLVK